MTSSITDKTQLNNNNSIANSDHAKQPIDSSNSTKLNTTTSIKQQQQNNVASTGTAASINGNATNANANSNHTASDVNKENIPTATVNGQQVQQQQQRTTQKAQAPNLPTNEETSKEPSVTSTINASVPNPT